MTVKKTVYRMDRRDLLKWTAAAGAGAFMVANFEEAYAQSQCDKLDNVAPASNATSGAELFYWIDGHFSNPWGTTLVTCAKMAVHVDLPQTLSSFVESVVLAETATGKIVQEQHMPASQKMTGDRAPYVIFDNLELDSSKGYSVYYNVREGANSTVHKFDIAAGNIRESRFDFAHLGDAKNKIPAQFRNDMNTANHSFLLPGAVDTTLDPAYGIGNITSPFHNFAGIPPHNVRTQIKSIGSNSDFEIALHAMHGDQGTGHFMRYFLVMDPVGRILGGLKRTFGDTTYANSDGSFVHVMNRGLVGDTTGFTDAEKAEMRARNILDCPYVMVFIEDVQDALARVTLRLR